MMTLSLEKGGWRRLFGGAGIFAKSDRQWLFRSSGLFGGQRVGQFIAPVAAMAAYPAPRDVPALDQSVQLLPEVVVDLALPALGHRIDHVGAVGADQDSGSRVNGLQALDDRRHLHAVVGGLPFAAGETLLVAVLFDDRAPAAWSGVAFARAVGVYDYVVVLHCGYQLSAAKTAVI